MVEETIQDSDTQYKEYSSKDSRYNPDYPNTGRGGDGIHPERGGLLVAPTLKPLPALGDDDPRALKYRAEYEDRMAQQGAVEEQDGTLLATARDGYEKAIAARSVAQEHLVTAQAEVVAAEAEITRWTAAHARVDSPRQFAVTPAETLCPGEETKLMVFPRDVTLQVNVIGPYGVTNGSRSALFPEGIQEVPVSLHNHQYLIDHGVRPYSGAVVKPKARKPTERVRPKVDPNETPEARTAREAHEAEVRANETPEMRAVREAREAEANKVVA